MRLGPLPLLVMLGACWSSTPASSAVPSPLSGAAATELTTVEAVLDAYLVAQGGRSRLEAITSMKSVGTLTTPKGLEGKLTILAAAPRSLLVTIGIPGLRLRRQGVSGDVVWEVTSRGARILTGSERAHQLGEATFGAGPLDWKTAYAKVTLEGVVERDGGRAYKLVYFTHDGDVQTEYYDVDTHLLRVEERLAVSQLGTIPVVTTYSDYRDVAGTKHPFGVHRTEGPSWMRITLESIETNVPIDPATFALPPEVAALP